MKKITTLLAIGCASLLSAHGALVYTTFDIPTGSTNVGTFFSNMPTLYDLIHLSPGAYERAYAYRSFTPSISGNYTIGMTNADYDPVMVLYSGKTNFPVADASNGAIEFNDDGNWSFDGNDVYFGSQVVNPLSANEKPGYMPLMESVSLTSGIAYLIAITSYDDIATNGGPSSIPLPTEFFVAGPAAVTLASSGGGDPAAVPEPGQVAASLLLLAGIGGYVFAQRRKAAKSVTAPVAA